MKNGITCRAVRGGEGFYRIQQGYLTRFHLRQNRLSKKKADRIAEILNQGRSIHAAVAAVGGGVEVKIIK